MFCSFHPGQNPDEGRNKEATICIYVSRFHCLVLFREMFLRVLARRFLDVDFQATLKNSWISKSNAVIYAGRLES
jgi:hypothetical protein